MIPNVKNIFKDSFKTSTGEYLNNFTEKEIDLLFEHQLLKCFLPKSVNGLGLSIHDTLKVIEDASYVNGSLGWLIQIGNGGNYFLSNFEEKIGVNLFSSPKSVIAGSGTATSIAKKVKGGLLISGKWKYCSGSEYATLFTITFLIDKTNEQLSGIVKREDVNILHDWNTIGMKNTSTNSIELIDVFIPDEHLFSVTNKKAFLNDPLFNLPFLIFAQVFFINVTFGIFKRLIDETEKIVNKGKKNQATKNHLLKLEQLNNRANSILVNAKKEIAFKTDLLVGKSNISNEETAEIQKLIIFHAINLREKALKIFISHGIIATDKDNCINILFNDLLVVCQHKLLNDE